MSGETGTVGFLPDLPDPEAVAVGSDEASSTWLDLERACHRVGNGLLRLGVAPRERIAILADNSLGWLEAFLGTLRVGAAVVPVNRHGSLDEIAYILDNSRARLLIVDETHEALGSQASALVGTPETRVIGASFEEWLGAQDDSPPPDRGPGFLMGYTSGTTGRPKGVVRPLGQSGPTLLRDVRPVAEIYGFGVGGAHLVVGPLYHGGPLMFALMALASGQRLVVRKRFDAAETLSLIERERVTSTHMVPTMFVRMLRLADEARTSADVSSLELVIHGAATCPVWVKEAMLDWLGPVLVEYYGSTEGTGPILATSAEWRAKPGTVGRPRGAIEISIVDGEGNDVAPGQVGTVYFRRPQGPPEYHEDPEKTSRSRLMDGRFTVGDMGYLDEEGYLFLTDRQIDMIISGGVNVYPAEVEAILLRHPAVADCAVFGIPDDEWGESVLAAVTTIDGGGVPEDELIQWCRGQIAHFKCPRSIEFHEALPRDDSGKLRKRELRDRYWQRVGRAN